MADFLTTDRSGASNGLSLAKFYSVLASFIGKCESALNSSIAELEESSDVGQKELLALQSKIQTWGNLTSTATGLLRAVGDSLKSTTQNIR
jgi:hypothetical protein